MRINEATMRLGAFIGIFIAVALWEELAPRRPRSFSRLTRWPSNLTVLALNGALVRILLFATCCESARARLTAWFGTFSTNYRYRTGAELSHPRFCWIWRFICST
jgi:hypothetical protein